MALQSCKGLAIFDCKILNMLHSKNAKPLEESPIVRYLPVAFKDAMPL